MSDGDLELELAWDERETAYPDTPVHLFIEQHASIDGDRVAVVDGIDSVTYAELLCRSDEIVAELLTRGVRHGDFVGVCLPRGIDAVASFLAILRVGATCVPLAVEQPAARLSLIRKDSGLTVIVTTTPHAQQLGVGSEHAVLLDVEPGHRPAARAPVPSPVAAEDIAYALYTSGSTGTPKAVLLTHANVSNFVQWCLHTGVVDADSRMVHANNLGFDAAIFDIFAPLAAGAVVCVAGREVVVSGAATVRWFVENKITVGFLTTRVGEACLAQPWPAESAMRCLIIGGERVTTWLPAHIPFDVIHAYGPTECSVWSAAMVLPPEPPGGGLPSFGRPISNTRIHLLDPSGQPVPAGEAGEIYISGAGVSAGYRGRADLTAERFLPDPFVPGARMYRTGDLGRMNSDGNLEFIGRLDGQIKLRGHRIELGEIEVALRSHPDIGDVAVLLREDRPGNPRLAAYLTHSDGRRPAPDSLREHLATRVPDYMIPADYIDLPRLPLTPNNKIDRDALPPPGNTRHDSSADYLAPRTAIERDLVALWEQLLGVSPIGVEDDFHALGGDSLLAGKLLEWIRRHHRADLRFSRVLAGATVRELAALIDEGAGGAAQEPGQQVEVGAHDADQPVPATSGQYGLWLQDQLAPQDRVYHETALLTIRGQIDPALVQDCLTDLVRRHEALRTCLRMVEGTLTQVVSEPMTIPVALHAVYDSVDEHGVAAALRELVDQLAQAPFDLATGPLLRAALLRSGPGVHVLVLVIHHAAVDGWSLDVLFDEFTAGYAAATSGGTFEQAPAPGFTDFAAWQNRRIRCGGFEPDVDYWRERLTGAPSVLKLPIDRARSTSATGPAAVVRAALSPRTARAMRELGTEQHVTPFMIVLAAYQAMLARWTGSSDIVVGSPLANRPDGFDRTVGYFLNMVPLRTEVSGSMSCRELFSEVRETVLGAHDHQAVPFPHLVQRILGTRCSGTAPMFQVALVSQEVQRRTFSAPGLEVEYQHGAPVGAKWDLTLHVTANRTGTTPGVELELEYRSDLFEKKSVRRVLDWLCGLLDSAMADPDRLVRDWVSEAATTQVLSGCNDTETVYPDTPVHLLFDEQAMVDGDRIAVTDGPDSVTYAQLRDRADSIARRLLDIGIHPGDFVGVCLPRGIDAVASLLAVLTAGAVCVPLDLDNPLARLAFIRDDAGLKITITTEELARRCELGSHEALLLDDKSVQDGPIDRVSVPVAGDAVAYVLYTSGSTGTPKGVLLTHANLATLIQYCVRTELVSARDRVGHATSLGFDASLFDVFAALSAGATVCVAHRDTIMSPAATVHWLADQGVTVMFLTTRLAEACLAQPWPSNTALRRLIAGGEALTVWRSPDVPCGILNIYGPTETTVWATDLDVPHAPAEGGSPPIGRPRAGVRIYLLDPNGRPVPPGATGEVHIAGAGVGLGYLHRPELNAERFLPDPFVAGARMYRTGDLARWNHEDNLQFVGRLDHQIKLRGHRIELGEIEATLRTHPDVTDAVVIVREDRPDHRRLVAYLTYSSARPPATSGLRRHVADRLPRYMMPVAYVCLSQFPLTTNKKVDRAALPEPVTARGDVPSADRGVPALVDRVRAIWEQTIEGAEIGVDDTLFEVGGSSLHIPELHRKITSQFDVPALGMMDFFTFPTLRTFTAHLAEQLDGRSSTRVSSAPRSEDPDTQDEDRSIAIIGMSGQFPGARTPGELWSLLCEGRECITRDTEDPPDSDWVSSVGLIPDRDGFDARLFDLSPADAELMDPQMRLFLETAWAALEDAGYGPRTQALPTVGVFGGSSFPRDWEDRFAAMHPEPGTSTEHRLMNGNPWQNLSTQVAYRLGLTGPALDVQTGCSTSLVAVHLACRSLATDDCAIALAGGVALTSKNGYLYESGGIMSPDGYCRPFDAQARGAVPGNGVGVVVLKRLTRALADHDTIHAVIRGSAVNNDGALKVGFVAPSIEGQLKAVRSAWRAANASAESISYIETHGTATVLGDSVEVSALTRAARADTDRAGFCALGSVKSNVGHLDAAAGVTGLIKAALAVGHGVIPATLHFRTPNSELDVPDSPFYVNATTIPWPDSGAATRRAAVSSFGVGGTNAHVVVDAPPTPLPRTRPTGVQLLPLSARTPAALDSTVRRLADHLNAGQDAALAHVAFTLRHGRAPLRYRRAVLCSTVEQAVATLRDEEHQGGFIGEANPKRPPQVVFMFPGVGTQFSAMGRDLYQRHPVYRTAFDRCAELLDRALDTDVRALLFPEPGREAPAEEQVLRPSRNMAVIFATEYALAELLGSWGIQPDAVIGHSLGEYTAACVSGMLLVEDAVTLVALRGRLCDDLPASAMLAVSLSMPDLTARLGEGLTVAAVNGPRHCTVTGPVDAIDELRSTLDADGIRARRLSISAGLHSPMMEPVMDQLAHAAAGMTVTPPKVPVVSTVTGDWLPHSESPDPAYWARQLRQPVQFDAGLTTLLDFAEEDALLVEVGPGRTLTSLTRLHALAEKAEVVVPPLVAVTAEDTASEGVLGTVAQLWCAGLDIDWVAFDADEQHARVGLPTYPFERSPVIPEQRGTPVAEQVTRQIVTDHAEVARVLAELWAELLGVEQPRDDDDFFDSGGHSLLAVEFSTRVRRALGTAVGAHLLLEHPTYGEVLGQVRALVKERSDSERADILIPLQRGDSNQTPIFLVQAIGGTVFTYRSLARHLGADRPVHAFRAIGLEEGETPFDSITDMAARYVDELLAARPDGPHILGGHSSGGVVAFEMAYQLIERGVAPPLVIMIDTVTLEQSRTLTSLADVEKLVDALLDIDPESTAALRTALAQEPRISEVVVTTNLALGRYYPRPCAVDILYVRAADRDQILDSGADRWWADYCEGRMMAHTIPGNHFSIVEDPFVAKAAELLTEHLDRQEVGDR